MKFLIAKLGRPAFRSCVGLPTLLAPAFFLALALLIPAAAQSQPSTSVDLSSSTRVLTPAAETSGLVSTRTSSSAPTEGGQPSLPIGASSSVSNPYGLAAIWLQGDWVAKGCLMLLVIMSMASWYALIAKALALRHLKMQTADAQNVFVDVRRFASHVAKLGADNPMRFVADAGSAAAHQYAAMRPRVDYDTWVVRAIEQALSGVQIRMQSGMAVLATIGSTAPFVGLFGTVWAIYSALIKIGASGQASIDRVAGPVGEALIMTAIGLAVAVPAVFGYNWLLRQNRLAFEALRGFGAQLHGLLLATTDIPDTAVVDASRASAGTAAPAAVDTPAQAAPSVEA